MHKHHGALRLLVILVGLVLAGLAVYFVLVYGFSRALENSQTVSTTPTYFPVATSSRMGTLNASSSLTSVATGTPEGEGIAVITSSNNNQTINLSKGERFEIRFGNNLRWSLSFNPPNSLVLVPNTTTGNGIQGIYEADQMGTTVMHATGAPICNPGDACPQFLLGMIVTFVVK